MELRKRFNEGKIDLMCFQEIRLRVGRPIVLIKDLNEYFISYDNKITCNEEKAIAINENELRETMEFISNYSMYAFEEEIRNGFITISGGHRIGICGRAVIENGKIKTIKNISFINIRIAHERIDCSKNLMRYLYDSNGKIHNTLIISPPMYGKTTVLRDIIRNISNGFNGFGGQNVGVSDERSEIAASYLGRPQNDVGIMTDVMDGMPKKYGIMMLIRTMSPKVIAVDEIGTSKDVESILYGINSGCRFVATAHAESIKEVKEKESIKCLMDRKTFKRFLVINKKENIRYVEIYDENLIKIGDELIE